MEKIKTILETTRGNQSSQSENQNIEYSFCEKHGKFKKYRIYPSGRQIQQECLACLKDKAKEAETKQRINDNYMQSNIPKRFRGLDLKKINRGYHKVEKHNEELRETIETVERYLDTYDERAKMGASGFFCGECGTGKTMIACMMIEDIIKQGHSAHYVTAWRMIQDVRQGYDKSGNETVVQLIDKYINKSFLVIDEIGSQRGTEDERMLLYQIIDGRYNEVKPTVIVSNLKNPVEDGYLDIRTIDRLKEGGGFSIVFNGESYRK